MSDGLGLSKSGEVVGGWAVVDLGGVRGEGPMEGDRPLHARVSSG